MQLLAGLRDVFQYRRLLEKEVHCTSTLYKWGTRREPEWKRVREEVNMLIFAWSTMKQHCLDCVSGWRLPKWHRGKESTCQCSLIPGSGKCPGERNRNPLSVFLPGKSLGQRNLEVYSPWCLKESDTTEWLNTKLFLEKKKKEKDVTIQQKIVCALMNWLESRDIWNKICSSGHKDKLLNLSCRQAVDYIFLCATSWFSNANLFSFSIISTRNFHSKEGIVYLLK